jgi:hypothetical protein
MRRLPPARAVVLMLAVCVGCTSTGSGPSPSASAGISSATSPASIGPVQGFEIIEPVWGADGSTWFLDLSWEAPVSSSVDRYVVSRDGVVVQDELALPSWRDSEVRPATRYEYEVVAISTTGAEGAPASRSIVTGAPPVAQARLQGPFVVAMQARNSRGIDDPVADGDLVFRFVPRCATGPCSVAWTVANHPTRAILARRGSAYGRRTRTPFLIRNCFGRATHETVVVRMRVRQGAVINGLWRARSISGLIRESSRSPECRTASIRWSFRGRIKA